MEINIIHDSNMKYLIKFNVFKKHFTYMLILRYKVFSNKLMVIFFFFNLKIYIARRDI